MAPIIFAFGRLAEILHQHALDLITAFGFFVYDDGNNTIVVAPDHAILQQLKDKHTRPMWLSFGAGVECLIKSVLLNHEVSFFRKGKLKERLSTLTKDSDNYEAARVVLEGIFQVLVTADAGTWMARELTAKDIRHVWDFDTGTLSEAADRLNALVSRRLMTKREFHNILNAVKVFALVRRNMHAHFHNYLNVAKSFNNDLEKLYVPMVNSLLEIYRRKAEQGT